MVYLPETFSTIKEQNFVLKSDGWYLKVTKFVKTKKNFIYSLLEKTNEIYSGVGKNTHKHST